MIYLTDKAPALACSGAHQHGIFEYTYKKTHKKTRKNHYESYSNRQSSLPDTLYALQQLAAAGAEIDFKDILSCHADLKAYLNLRDNSDLYAQIRGTECLGIPCFIKEDGNVTLDLSEVLK